MLQPARVLKALVVFLWLSIPAALPARQQAPADNVDITATKATSTPDGAASNQFAVRNPRYRIGRSDVLAISFPLSPELNQKVAVQPDGYISLESAGAVHVEGLTVSEVVDAVKQAYLHTLHDPIVNVDLEDFQKPTFTVWGQVGKPGKYELREDTTVTQALAMAGGLEATGKAQVLLYRAVSSNWAEVHELKLNDFLHGKNINEDVHLQPGDMLFVPEKTITNIKKYVPYGVGLTPPYPTAF